MIAEALDHVADRYRHENAILTNIRKARDEAARTPSTSAGPPSSSTSSRTASAATPSSSPGC